MLDRDVILAAVAHRGRGERLLGRAARLWRGERVLGRLQCDGPVTLTIQIGDVRFFIVFHADQRRREARDLRLFGDHQRDRLAAEPDPVVVERPERRTFRSHLVLVGAVGARHARPILMRQHVDHAFNGKRLARVDARDAALGDRGRNDAGMREAGRIELAGIFRRAGDLGAAVDAGCGGADVSRHGPAPAHRIFLLDCDCGVPAAACVSARTMARRARSILKALCSKPLASRSTRSAARANVVSVGGLPAQRRFG